MTNSYLPDSPPLSDCVTCVVLLDRPGFFRFHIGGDRINEESTGWYVAPVGEYVIGLNEVSDRRIAVKQLLEGKAKKMETVIF